MAKRQLSLFETFALSADTTKDKRVKLTPAIPTTPFDRDAFIASLDREAKGTPSLSEYQLLKLESDTLELSWLDALATEIRKPYFIKLKLFLWQQGLRGTDHRQTSVFPPGSFSAACTPCHTMTMNRRQ